MSRHKVEGGVKRYSLSFTAGSFLPNDCVCIASAYLETMSWEKTYQEILAGKILVTRRLSTAQRIGSELIKRLKVLSDGELMRFVEAPFEVRNAWLWVAVCRCYALIGEFAQEVIRNRFIVGQQTIATHEYDSFYADKARYVASLNDISEATYKKIKSTTFKLAYEAGILDKKHTILPTTRSVVIQAMIPTADLGFFPIIVLE